MNRLLTLYARATATACILWTLLHMLLIAVNGPIRISESSPLLLLGEGVAVLGGLVCYLWREVTQQ